MPRRVERALERRATKLGLVGERRKAYVYGTLQRIEKRRAAK